MWGASRHKLVKTTRAFWPPDSSLFGIVCACPSNPKRPRSERASWYVRSENLDCKYSTGLLSIGSTSTKCWEYLPMRKNRLRVTSPEVGSRSPISRDKKVDLPTPFG